VVTWSQRRAIPRRGRGRPAGSKNHKQPRNVGLLGLVRTLRSTKAARQNLSDEEGECEGPDPKSVVMLSPGKRRQKLRVIKVTTPPLSPATSNNISNGSGSSSTNNSDEEVVNETDELEKRVKCQTVVNTIMATLRDLVRMLPNDSGQPSTVSGSMFCTYPVQADNLTVKALGDAIKKWGKDLCFVFETDKNLLLAKFSQLKSDPKVWVSKWPVIQSICFLAHPFMI
jgi:hypothetical protein